MVKYIPEYEFVLYHSPELTVNDDNTISITEKLDDMQIEYDIIDGAKNNGLIDDIKQFISFGKIFILFLAIILVSIIQMRKKYDNSKGKVFFITVSNLINLIVVYILMTPIVSMFTKEILDYTYVKLFTVENYIEIIIYTLIIIFVATYAYLMSERKVIDVKK